MTKERFNNLPIAQKREIFEAHAQEVTQITHHSLKTFVRIFRLYKLFHFFIETTEVGYYDNDNSFCTDNESLNPIAFGIEDKKMDHWLHFTNFSMELMWSISEQ
jgi:hypothetical protein